MPRTRLPLSAALVLVVMLLAGPTHAYYPRPAFHGVDHGAAVDCWDCHWFDAENAFNALYVSPFILGADLTPPAGPDLYSISYSGYQDLVKPDRRGVCQVCHTQTKYWGAGYDWSAEGWPELHFPEDNCLSCHPHWQPEDLFRPQMKGPQSHATHLSDCKGPRLPDCTSCHYPTDYSRFSDGQQIDSTAVCDICHSPNGPVDGINDSDVGAKPNWLHGVYEGNQLKAGKEHWCDGCHDSGTSVVFGVQAPNVLGDNTTWGYNITGHGRNPESYVGCLGCHTAACDDPSFEHCDGKPRSYSSVGWPDIPSNYVSGYRLGQPMNIPRDWYRDGMATDYTLCLSCHDSVSLFSAEGIMKTNFRNDRSWVFASKNLHLLHLVKGPFSHGPLWDSDWNGSNFNDSPASCPACHNVHGSPTPKMTRHGELMGLGSQGLEFRWSEQDGTTPTTILEDSRWGASQLSFNTNRICAGCHGHGSDRYFRVPHQVLVPTPGAPAPQPVFNGLVWTSDWANNPKTVFRRGEVYRVHCVYYVCPYSPPPPYRVVRRGSISGSFSQPLARDIAKSQAEGVYEAVWDDVVPPSAALGPATIKVLVKTTVLGVDYKERNKCTIQVSN